MFWSIYRRHHHHTLLLLPLLLLLHTLHTQPTAAAVLGRPRRSRAPWRIQAAPGLARGIDLARRTWAAVRRWGARWGLQAARVRGAGGCGEVLEAP